MVAKFVGPSTMWLTIGYGAVSTTELRVVWVPIGNDEWVQQSVQEKAAAVQVDVGKLDIISDGLIHYQMLRFCQNTRLAFLGRDTPTPLTSDIFAEVDATIFEALCRKGTTNAHGEWTAIFRHFVHMKLQLPHFRGGFDVTPYIYIYIYIYINIYIYIYIYI